MSIFTRGKIFISADKASYFERDEGAGTVKLVVNGTTVFTASATDFDLTAALKLAGAALLPNGKYATAALQSATMTAAQVAGANIVAFVNTGTTPANLQMPTAADIVAAMPGAVVGQSYLLKIRNQSGSANTATITTNTGITLTGTMTIAQNTTRDFMVTLTSLTAVDVRSIGLSAAGA